MRQLPLLALHATLATMVLFPPAASACTCYYNSIQVEFDNSTAVFRGVATSNNVIDVDGYPVRLVTFTVSECWKGDVPQGTAIYTGITEAGCGYTFHVGTEYLVFANGPTYPWWTGYCNLTSPWAGGGEWIADQLGTSGCTVAVEDRTWGSIKQLFE